MDIWQSFLDSLKTELDSITNYRSPAKMQANSLTARQHASQPLVIGPKESIRVGPKKVVQVGPKHAVHAVIVQPPARGLWDERGWTCEHSNGVRYFQGYYQSCRRNDHQHLTWPGRIFVRGNEVTLYIADPPANLSQHPKGVCFHNEEGRWFRLHWHHAARNVDDAILYMERILYELINTH